MIDHATVTDRPHDTAVRPRPRLLDTPIGALPRVLLVIAALCLLPTYLFPLWNMTMFAP